MKKINALTSIVPVLAVSLLLPAFVGAADPMSGSPSAGSATQGSASGSANQPSAAPAAAAPTSAAAPAAAELPANWTKVNGTIQEVNVTDRQVKIQDDKGALSQVTVGTDVTIRKEGKTVALNQLQTGDQVTLTRKKSAGSATNKG